MVARDLARYVDPGLVSRPQWGADWRSLALDQRWPSGEAINLPVVRAYYGPVRIHVRLDIMRFLESWRQLFRIHGVLLALAALLALAGVALARDGRERRPLVLLTGFAATLFVVPTATIIYQARYGIPGAVLLFIVGVRGAEILLARMISIVRRRKPARPGYVPQPNP
jgi:heme A synthase